MGATNVSAAEADANDLYSAEELSGAIASLTLDQRRILMLAEQKFLGGTRFGAGQLVQEAFVRALLKKRRCPRSVPVLAFLINSMRSIASHDREEIKAQREAELHEDRSIVPHANSPFSMPRTPEELMIDAEREASSEISVDTILSHFEGDEEAQLVLVGLADGLRGEPLRQLVDGDQAKLDYTMKRIRRKIKKLYPRGLCNDK